MKDTGGPAFPYFGHAEMTMRDYFAGQVLAGIWTNVELLKTLEHGQESKTIAMVAYEQADAMLQARQS